MTASDDTARFQDVTEVAPRSGETESRRQRKWSQRRVEFLPTRDTHHQQAPVQPCDVSGDRKHCQRQIVVLELVTVMGVTIRNYDSFTTVLYYLVKSNYQLLFTARPAAMLALQALY